MIKTVEQWLLFKYINGEFTPVETFQYERAGRKGTPEISRASA